MNIPNICLILLAGGESSRMRSLTKDIPKVLLPVYDNSLLQQHINHAGEAGIKKIIVSTKPKWSKIFSSHLSRTKQKNTVNVFSNPAHRHGSLPALLAVAKTTDSDYILMSLTDIFFFNNPYTHFIHNSNGLCVLGVSKPFRNQELTGGGIVFIKNNKIQSIKERPIRNNKKGWRWSGLALFSDLDLFLRDHPKNSPEGDFFEYWRSRGNTVCYRECSDFINVNTASDLLLASLYNFSFRNQDETLRRFTSGMRKKLVLP